MKRIVVKIGSNVLTREDGSLDITRMSALVDQIAALKRKGLEILVVTSGAGVVHAYFDSSADLEKGTAIINNAKTRRVSVCNALTA